MATIDNKAHQCIDASRDINTLVQDIYHILDERTNHTFNEENVETFGRRVAHHVRARLEEQRNQPSLRLSNLGTKCLRKLWYQINEPDRAEVLPPSVRFKFLFGDILEDLLLFLAKEAGHSVQGEQDELNLHGVIGHRDAIIDGRIVDCKSASTYSFKKFERNGLREDDPFGYLTQLNGYIRASEGDSRVTERDVGSFLVVDKTLGNICLDTYPTDTETNYEEKINDIKDILSLPKPPPRAFEPVPEGKSGNQKLCTNCSYCSFKFHCWPNLRSFAYSTGPVFLTTVIKQPKVEEVTCF